MLRDCRRFWNPEFNVSSVQEGLSKCIVLAGWLRTQMRFRWKYLKYLRWVNITFRIALPSRQGYVAAGHRKSGGKYLLVWFILFVCFDGFWCYFEGILNYNNLSEEECEGGKWDFLSLIRTNIHPQRINNHIRTNRFWYCVYLWDQALSKDKTPVWEKERDNVKSACVSVKIYLRE